MRASGVVPSAAGPLPFGQPAGTATHDGGFYASDEEFRALITPFVEQGVAAGQPVILGYDDRKSDLLRSCLPDTPTVTFVTGSSSLYGAPTKAIASWRTLVEEKVAAGATRIRIAGDVPHEGNGGRFDGWDRYESAINVVWNDLPVHSFCLYDATTVAPQVRDVVERTHPHLVTADSGRAASDRYEDPAAFAGLPASVDPIVAAPPLRELEDAAPAEARDVLDGLARGLVDEETLDHLRLGLSEALTNAIVHGRAPTSVRIWATGDRVVVHVHDRGPGPRSPLAGLVPSPSETGAGLGLWLTHQLPEVDVALLRAPDGFTVQLRA